MVKMVYEINRCTSAESLEYVKSASWVARVTPTYVSRTHSSTGWPWRPSKPKSCNSNAGKLEVLSRCACSTTAQLRASSKLCSCCSWPYRWATALTLMAALSRARGPGRRRPPRSGLRSLTRTPAGAAAGVLFGEFFLVNRSGRPLSSGRSNGVEFDSTPIATETALPR